MNRFKKWISSPAFTNQMALLLIVLAIGFGVATYGAFTATGPFNTADADTVYILLNIEIFIFILLCIMTMRRFFGLWKRRKEKAAGTKLQLRLITAFSLIALIPSIIMALFSLAFFYFAIQSWFSDRVGTAVNESLAVAQAYLKEHQKVIQADTLAMASDLNRDALSLIGNQPLLTRVMEKQAFLRNLSEAMIFDENGRVIAKSGFTFSLEFDSLPTEYLDQAKMGNVVVLTDDDSNRVRALVHLDNFGNSYLYVGRLIEAGVLDHITTAQNAVEEYLALDVRKSDFRLSITLIFLCVAVTVLLAAALFGLLFARRIADPLSELIRATERVRAGDFNIQIKDNQSTDDDDDELSLLVRGFNKMTHQINNHQKDLIEANRLLENRRHFIEAVFSGVTSGIMGVDPAQKITLANQSAADILLLEKSQLIGQSVYQINDDIGRLLEKGLKKDLDLIQEDMTLVHKNGKSINVLVRIAYEKKDAEQMAVITLDDVTDLMAAQRKAAWSGVARRIAHEIKNPLTPIQLSAERLQRKYKDQITKDQSVFTECTETIIRQVSEIGRMVNEFAEFARMPEPHMKDENVIELIKSSLVLQRQAYHQIDFKFSPPKALSDVRVSCDAGLISQALNNVIKNAVEAVEDSAKDEKPRITIDVERDDGHFMIKIHDNGPGIDDDKMGSITEPYVTTKEKGTGLGLAIVKKIMEDHNGSLTIENRISHNCVIGATVVLSLPQ